ncbi:putative thiamine biosynthetic bifunctional enzyme, chloroplastic [Apostasia shenzhenica]|uniref:Putative thiamine biosynthetic bifunctional enzyme, chloroplastic n=1 Tax=Apostasia shenzhenica TaxID=1088818 RepID=A0A2I0BG67_9ASPA|nr:putative thiamine biosynthetic bifunctional enzyme, chloroplastic [Apostasia shenzhenica]
MRRRQGDGHGKRMWEDNRRGRRKKREMACAYRNKHPPLPDSNKPRRAGILFVPPDSLSFVMAKSAVYNSPDFRSSAAASQFQISVSSTKTHLVGQRSLVVLPKKMAERKGPFAAMSEERASACRMLPHVLTVAGSDSGAGAGIQADIKACGAAGVYCSSVITAVTAQNTFGVQGVYPVVEDFVAEQLRSVLSDMQVDVVKTGMLPSAGVIKVLCQSIKEFPVRAVVVDPVMVSTSGDVLSGPETLSGFREELLPLADIVTPNLKEASALLGGISLETVADMRHAAKSIYDFGARNVLVKGGDFKGSSDAIDILFDGEQFHELCGPRIATRNTHGTGCTLASYIAAELAKRSTILHAVQAAKNFVEGALLHSKDLMIGNGPQGPFDHLFRLKSQHHIIGNKFQFNPNDLFLYAVTDSGMNRKWGRSITAAVKASIEGGATIVQLREKEAESREFIEAATKCVEICRSYCVPLIINDRIDVALACDADGVHVGQSDMPADLARKILGPDKIIGVSCKTPAHAERAWADGANYIGCGGVFSTDTKKNNVTIGLEGLKAVCCASKLPVVAVGGIGAGNVQSVMELGVPNLKGVAVVSALFDRECVTTEAHGLRTLLMEVPPKWR